MSNKSGVSGQVIALPQGGGALHGFGEKFSPDLHTGTGNFTIPIALPSGRNGFQSQLSLVYSTGSGNGPFGLGWNLSIPGVSRKTSKGIPYYDDAQDTFILSEAEDLVSVDQKPGTICYRPRTEGLFARIAYHHGASNSYWEVRSKDGLVSLYGTPATASNDPAAIAKPTDRSRVFAWRLTRTTDPFGNRIDYMYERDTVQTDGPHQWDQLYLSEIRYGDYGNSTQPKFLIRVKFTYENRPDPFSEYGAGFEIRTIRRCTRIEVFTEPGKEILTRSYHLIYLDQRNSSPQLPRNGVSLLSQVKVEGHEGSKSEWLPPLEFNYTRFEPEERKFFPIRGKDLPAYSLANPALELADLFGNGLPDILEMNGTVRYWRNLGGGRFDLPRPMQTAPAGLNLADKGVQLIDANGDGRIDLLVTTESINGYYPLRFGGLWDRRSFQRYRNAPSFDLKDPEVKLVDLDGDGVTDVIRSGSRLECFFNDPYEGWNKTRRVERRSLEEFPNINFSDPRVKWGDMTGDGLQDILLVHDGHVEYWPSLGRGDWGKRVSMHNSPRFRYGYDPRRILVGDVDGDGLADIVYVDDRKVILWINQSGNSWSAPIEIKGTPPVSDMDAVRLVDLLGNGISGVLWSSDANGLSHEHMFFLDFTGGIKPYLLNEMDNHMGSITRVAYAASTTFYLEDEKHRGTHWKTSLPFPVQVVAQVEVIDALSQSKLTTEYRYHHGYWDGAEREFRGFGRVDQKDTQTFAEYHTAGLHPDQSFTPVATKAFSPPLETRTWFHQGPIGDEFGDWTETDFSNEFWAGDPQILSRPAAMTNFLKRLPRRMKRDALRTLRGSILRTELYALDGTERQSHPYTVTEHLQGVMSLPIGAAWSQHPEEWRQKVFFPHALAERTTQWERGTEPMTQFKFTNDYDLYGQAHQQTQIACPRDWKNATNSRSNAYLATYTETAYAQRDDVHHYMVDRVAKTSTYKITDKRNLTVFELKDGIDNQTVAVDLFGQTLNFYDGSAFQGLPFGHIGDHGALVRTETLVLTEKLLHQAYAKDSSVPNPTEAPPYLKPGGTVSWTAEYPQAFRQLLPTLAGYSYYSENAGSEHAAGYFAVTEQRRYDFQEAASREKRGLVTAKRDPLNHETQIQYDSYFLLPVKVTDPAKLTTQAEYDYRVLQPKQVIDPNQNQTAYTFTPLGLLASAAVTGKPGKQEGDTLAVPGTRLEYDFLAFTDRKQPIAVRTIRRVHHVNETDIPLPERDETIQTVEYSDGFGRLLQTRTQAEDITFGDSIFGDAGLPADQAATNQDAVGHSPCATGENRVVVSGWQIYDNKGRVVEKYEPFFACGWNYAEPTDAEQGQRVEMYYDPRGQVIRTVNPDGSEQRVIYGIPVDLDTPDSFTPTPWEAYTYDANDNAGRTHADSARAYQYHWNTPSNIVIDALGRKIETVERNRAKPKSGNPLPAIEEYRTRSTYDIRGNLLTVTDALDRLAFQHVYNLANQPLRIENIDAGVRRTVLDAAGNEIERRDSKDALMLHAYDVLNRPIRLWARDGMGQVVTLRERIIYGDSPDSGRTAAQAQAANLLGKLYQHDDEAGQLAFETYDFKGNVLEKVRQVIADSAILSAFSTAATANWQVNAFRANWETASTILLDPIKYNTSIHYDALNRIKTMQYPQDVEGKRKLLRPHYNQAGALERVDLDGNTYVERIAYNAKGQRVLIAYGNGIMTRYAYDPKTFRLMHLKSEHYTQPNALTYHPTGAPFQDFAYTYDLVGNILSIQDRTSESGILNNPEAAGVSDPQLAQLLASGNALLRHFEYDPLYRLLFATGRECDTPPISPPWDDKPRCTDLTKTRGYTEQYQYDSVGNIQQLQHQGNGSFNRQFALANNSDRLATVTIGQKVYAYTYDANGNLIQENASRHFEWDHSDHMRIYRTQTGNAEPSVHAHYLYDASGQRVKKLVRKQGGQIEVTVYIDGIFEHHRQILSSTTKENNTLHVVDNQQRIALIRVGTSFSGDTTPAVKYQLGDHLGSSNVVVDNTATLINREEYTPYGETSFGSFAKKRYRFTGKERDEESQLYYYGARYYAPWLARWTSCDPAEMSDGVNVYKYVLNNPIHLVDLHGFQSSPSDESYWSEVKANVLAARDWVNNTADKIGSRATETTREALQKLGIKGGVADTIAAGTGALLNTAGVVLGGIVMTGPNLMVELSEVPERFEHGGSEIRRGIKVKNWESVVSGTGEILEGAGTIASTFLFAESAVRAAETRTAISTAKAPAPPGFKENVVGPKPATGSTPGTAYHRVVKDMKGNTVSKTTTVVSREGVVVRQHADFYGKSGGMRAGTKPSGVKPRINPTFPEKWTGTKEIPRGTAPLYSRTKTPVLHSTSKLVKSGLVKPESK